MQDFLFSGTLKVYLLMIEYAILVSENDFIIQFIQCEATPFFVLSLGENESEESLDGLDTSTNLMGFYYQPYAVD